jgi:hypothetical protein
MGSACQPSFLLYIINIGTTRMYRLAEEVARKILRNIKSPEIGPMDITQPDPFMPKNLDSIGFVDCYAAVGTAFRYVIELPHPFINSSLPPIEGLDGYWLYRSEELQSPIETFSVPRYLADPNILTAEEQLDVTDCAIVLPDDISKLTCISLMTFEQLITHCPDILDCMNPDLK